MIKVSVIITTYNAARCIARTLGAVFHQEGINRDFTLEVILVDDCSTDATVLIAKKFNVDVTVLPVNTGGPNRGRNLGLQKATGDYICFLDHDDVWMPFKIRTQLEAAQLAPIITGGYNVINENEGGYSFPKCIEQVTVFKRNETFLKKLSKEKDNIQNTYLSTIMIRSDLKHIRFEEHFGMLDYDWLLRLFENNTSVEVPVNLALRFVNDENLSLNQDYRKKDYYYSLMSLEAYERKYPREVSLALKRIHGSRARYWYVKGEMREARKYLLRAMPGVKETLYYITTFVGSRWVKKKFTVFG